MKVHESLIPGKLILSIEGGDDQPSSPSMPEKEGFRGKYAVEQANLVERSRKQQTYGGRIVATALE